MPNSGRCEAGEFSNGLLDANADFTLPPERGIVPSVAALTRPFFENFQSGIRPRKGDLRDFHAL
jgi:hypothetical protein